MRPSGHDDGHPGLLGRSEAMVALRGRITAVARTSAPVLVAGEGGTGKGLIARCVHASSDAPDAPFAAVDCRAGCPSAGADMESVYELIEAARGPATVYLSEVNALSPERQVRLSRAIAASSTEPDPVRVVASASVDLRAMTERGDFAPDLFYALAVAQLHSLPLRRMPEDVPILMAHFVAEEAARFRRAAPDFGGNLPYLLSHDWPGNVPELRNHAARLVLGFEEEDPERAAHAGGTLAEQVDWFERQVIARRLAECGGDIQAACRGLAVSRTTLYEKINRHGLRVEGARRGHSPRGRRPSCASNQTSSEVRTTPPYRKATGHASKA